MVKSNLTLPKSHELIARRILRTSQAAEYVGLSSSTLEKMRLADGGPRFLRLGSRAVGYDIADLDDWLDQQKKSSSVK